MNEIDEFYSYVEMPQVTENMNAWKDSFPEGTPLLIRDIEHEVT
jgi:hypothetical protein